MSRNLILLVLMTAMLSATSCATSRKGGKKHKRPSKGGGKGCDCPGFSRQSGDGDFHWYGNLAGQA